MFITKISKEIPLYFCRNTGELTKYVGHKCHSCGAQPGKHYVRIVGHYYMPSIWDLLSGNVSHFFETNIQTGVPLNVLETLKKMQRSVPRAQAKRAMK